MATFTVTTLADSVNASDGKLSLREALTLANAKADADTVTFAAALEGGTLKLTRGELAITSDLTIDGDPNSDGRGVTIDGQYNSRVLEVGGTGTAATLRGMTLTHGFSGGYESGGGGAIFGNPGADITVERCALVQNLGSDGGGIAVEAGKLTVLHSTITHNAGGDFELGGWGGGIFAENSSVLVAYSAIIENDARRGGGIAISGEGANLILKSSTVANNSYGGIFGDQYTSIFVNNSTITGNEYLRTIPDEEFFSQIEADFLQLSGSIVLSKGSSVYAQMIISDGRNVVGHFVAPPIDDIADVDPAKVFAAIDLATGGGKLVLVDGTWVAPLRDAADNPALRLADPAAAGSVDQRGIGRPAPDGTLPDAGAYELKQKASDPNVPTSGNDLLRGTNGNDVIDALAGNDQIRGFEGDDLLKGGPGRDLLLGGADDDRLDGGPADDLLEGGPGADRLDGASGIDTASYAHATAGVTVNLALSGPQVTEGAGTDTLVRIENVTGSGHDDVLSGNGEDNRILGGDGVDVLHGGAGNDVLDAGGRPWDDVRVDMLFGDAGNDDLYDTSGDSILCGGQGNDRLIGAEAGRSTAGYSDAPSAVTVDLSKAGTQDTLGAGRDTLLNIQDLVGSNFADRLTGNEFNNTLDGAAGDDILRGGDGDDVLNGSAGSDQLYGGAGRDEASYADVEGSVQVSLAQARAYGAAGKDWLYGIESVQGGNGWDSIAGDAGWNDLFGGAGNDSIYGLSGDDSLYGGSGDDRLYGGLGADVLEGGAGNDRFAYADWRDSTRDAPDFITGFDGVGASAGDRIDLAAVYAGTLTFRGTGVFTGVGQVRIDTDESGYSLVLVNLTGNTAPEMEIQVNSYGDQWVAGDFVL